MSNTLRETLGRILRDSHVVAALLAGPACWLLLWALGLPLSERRPATTTLVYGILIYPLLEEFVFRGGLQGWLLGFKPLMVRRLGISAANIMASLAFAAAHLFNQPPMWAAAVFIPSLVFGHLYERHSSVTLAFVVHAFYNAGFLLLFVQG